MYFRYIYYGGTRERNSDNTIRQIGVAHNSAFRMAAKNVAKDYASAGDKVNLVKITTAAKLVGKINSLPEGSLKSLDLLSHGTPYSLNFSVAENKNAGLVTGSMAKLLLSVYYSEIFSGEFYNFGIQSRFVRDINFSIFTNDARIQIHGCNTARGNIPGDTLSEAMSNGLWDAGKKLAYVIAHTTKSNPNINGAKTTIAGQDYRHGKRAILHKGEVLYTTNAKGYLAHDEIIKKLGN